MFFDDILIISIIFVDFLTFSQFMCNVMSSTNVIFGMGISPPPLEYLGVSERKNSNSPRIYICGICFDCFM